MKTRERWASGATALLVIAAIAIAVTNVYAIFFQPGNEATARSTEPVYIDNWEHLLEDAIIVGDRSAEVMIIEFADLSCTYCRRFHDAFQEVRERFEDRVALAYMPFPIGRPNSMDGAIAAECAHAQEAFYDFIDVVFEHQDAIAPDQWTLFADEAGIGDLPAFDQCVSDTDSFPRIDRGLELTRELGLTGTPSVIMNGWHLPRVPYDDLSDVVARALAGDEPW